MKLEKFFIRVNLAVALCIILPFFILAYGEDTILGLRNRFLIMRSVIGMIMCVLLSFFAFKITQYIQKILKIRPNNCLVYWHIANVFINTIATLIFTAHVIGDDLKDWTDGDELKQIERVIGDLLALYQDLFLLYLLHRFTSHQKVSVHGQFLNSLFVF